MADEAKIFSVQDGERVAKVTRQVEGRSRWFEGADYGTPPDDSVAGPFMVLVKANGDDGGSPALPRYDLFAITDTSLVTPLNLAGPLSPSCSRARLKSTMVVTAAADGAYGLAFYDGVIKLFDCPETPCSQVGVPA